ELKNSSTISHFYACTIIPLTTGEKERSSALTESGRGVFVCSSAWRRRRRARRRAVTPPRTCPGWTRRRRRAAGWWR
ncbi:Os05g0516550, partial [Oryza sativa Japonica Group]